MQVRAGRIKFGWIPHPRPQRADLAIDVRLLLNVSFFS